MDQGSVTNWPIVLPHNQILADFVQKGPKRTELLTSLLSCPPLILCISRHIREMILLILFCHAHKHRKKVFSSSLLFFNMLKLVGGRIFFYISAAEFFCRTGRKLMPGVGNTGSKGRFFAGRDTIHYSRRTQRRSPVTGRRYLLV